jgi:Flp pilus assembly protein TadG
VSAQRQPGIGTTTGASNSEASMSRKLTQYLRRRAAGLARFRRARDGATAVEFALIAPAFLAMLIAIFEVMYFLFAQQTLQTAAVELGRLFMTNQSPTQNSTVNSSGQLVSGSSVCNIIQPLLSCGSVVVNVQSYQDWQSANTSMPSMYGGSGCAANTGWSYAAGTPGQVVVIQLMYPLRIVTGPLGFALSNSCNGAMQVMGITAIRVEPS